MAIILAFLAFLSFSLTGLFAILAITNRIIDVPMNHVKIRHNPMHFLIYPSLLTNKGKRYQRLFFINWIFFLCIIAFGAIYYGNHPIENTNKPSIKSEIPQI
jgi:hypothetical protein